MKYTLIIEKGSEAYWGYFPDLPGCTTGGETIEAVVENAGEALALYIEESGSVPPPRPLPAILADPEVAGNLTGTELFAAVESHAEPVAAF